MSYQPTIHNRRLLSLKWLVVLLASTACVWLLRKTFIDDAMITLAYARTLGLHGYFSIFPGATHYGFTSPLNLLLVTVVGRIVGFDLAIPAATGLLLTWLLYLCRRLAYNVFGQATTGLCLFLLLSFNPLIASTLGLESLLGVALSVGAISQLHSRHWRRAGGFLGALVLTRPDYAVVFVLSIALFPTVLRARFDRADRSSIGRPLRRSVALRILSFGIPLIALWHGFAWLRLGSALPLTFFIKTASSWSPWNFFNGWLLYLRTYPLASISSLCGVVGLLALLRTKPTNPTESAATAKAGLSARQRLAAKTAVLGGAHFLALGILFVPPYHWYFVPSLGLLLVAAWIAAFDWASRQGKAKLITLVGYGIAIGGASVIFAHGVPDQAPIHTNWATHQQYREVGRWLEQQLPPGTRIALSGEIGTMQYYAPSIRLLDPFSDPDWVTDKLLPGDSTNPSLRALLIGINFAFLPNLVGEPLPPPSLCLNAYQTPLGPDALLQDHPLHTWSNGSRWTPDSTVVLLPCRDGERRLRDR